MASLRLPCSSPSTTHYFTTDNHYRQKLHKSYLYKPFSQSNVKSTFFLSHSPKNFNHFIIKSSAVTQDPVLESSSENEQKQGEEEEFSTTRVLASNIPWSSTPEDIRAMFEKFGTVLDVELSMYNKFRNRGLAFVTMSSPEEAATAIEKLDLTEYEGRTLKMNYAKLKRTRPPSPPRRKITSTFNLFVANLSYEAKDSELKEFFKSEGADVVSAEIVYHNHEKIRKPSGYGFVSFKTKKDAEAALSTFADREFLGRPIRVARSRQFARPPRETVKQSDNGSTETNSGVELVDAPSDS